MKLISFLGDSRDDFPDGPRYRAGVELRAVQNGIEPDDWKPHENNRAWRAGDQDQGLSSGAFRIIYLATLADRVLVLHAFQKKTRQTAQRDIELATRRLRDWKAQQ